MGKNAIPQGTCFGFFLKTRLDLDIISLIACYTLKTFVVSKHSFIC